LTQIQEMTGRWFSLVQGGTFAPGPSESLVRQMREWGAAGVGQSSWGPAVYGVLAGETASTRLAQRLRSTWGPACAIYEGAFPSDGARTS